MPDLRLIKGRMSDPLINISICPFQDSAERLSFAGRTATCKGRHCLGPLTLTTVDGTRSVIVSWYVRFPGGEPSPFFMPKSILGCPFPQVTGTLCPWGPGGVD
jgi:hypothetical protein